MPHAAEAPPILRGGILSGALCAVAFVAAAIAALSPNVAWVGFIAAAAIGADVIWRFVVDGAAAAEAGDAATAQTETAADPAKTATASPARADAAPSAPPADETMAPDVSAALHGLAKRLKAGDLTARFGDVQGLDPEVGKALDAALTEVNTAVDEALALADIAAAGDLSARSSGAYHGHSADLAKAMNGLLDGLAGMVATLREAVADTAARGVEMREVAGEVLQQSERQATALGRLSDGVGAMEKGLGAAASLAGEGQEAVSAAVAAASDGRERITAARQAMNRISEASKKIDGVLEMIDLISQQTTLLAVNAGVEAARAGPAGRGFAVVTEEIGMLASRTVKAAKEIAEIVHTTAEEIRVGDAMVSECDAAIHEIVESVSRADDRAARIQSACAAELEHVASATDALGETRAAAEANLSLASRAAAVAQALDASARDLDDVVAGFQLDDERMLAEAQSRAAEVVTLFETALSQGQITLEALFSQDYARIDGSNPAQFMAPFVQLTDRVLPPLLESVYDLGDGVAFSAAVNVDGFLPTHNAKFSKPPGGDPVWNAANCRNRRFFQDRVGLACGRSRAPGLLQVYRRDMGGGAFVTMKDVSAPIVVRGRHWGGLRIGYRSASAGDGRQNRSVQTAPQRASHR